MVYVIRIFNIVWFVHYCNYYCLLNFTFEYLIGNHFLFTQSYSKWRNWYCIVCNHSTYICLFWSQRIETFLCNETFVISLKKKKSATPSENPTCNELSKSAYATLFIASACNIFVAASVLIEEKKNKQTDKLLSCIALVALHRLQSTLKNTNYKRNWNIAQRFALKFGVIGLSLNDCGIMLMTTLIFRFNKFQANEISFLYRRELTFVRYLIEMVWGNCTNEISDLINV